ncbi:helix-turn-helix domain-containing protein [Actinoplanes sp. N902-109]|uniref:helix-turn-helix domain-containing protein n=1 Tax=Actinoplanes sp. (strain N902-109) TaxID=649831 RepID=UPI00032942AB|nr:helix-turn-helix domain-containing protein [Actinoplanes sp. N902-109]AGL18081.1 transcriptional regulator [Actinoplanes sp. N902-109]
MYRWNEPGLTPTPDAWREAFIALHGASRVTLTDTGPWAGRLEWQRSRSYGIALCGNVREEFVRERRHIRTDPRGMFELLVPTVGSAQVEQAAAAGEIGPGALALCDVDRPLTFAHGTNFLSVALIFPGEAIYRRNPTAAQEPHVFDGTAGLGRLIHQTVLTLQQDREHLSEATFDIVCDQVLDLLCLAAEGAGDSAPATQRRQVEAQVRQYVRRHAADPHLSITGIARALGWSARYLQDVLQAAGTTSRDLIRSERLRLARTRLAGPAWDNRSIAEVAYASGFASHASFATAYRREFGSTPRETRGDGRGES